MNISNILVQSFNKIVINHLYLFSDKDLSYQFYCFLRFENLLKGWSDESLSYDKNKNLYIIYALNDLSYCSINEEKNYCKCEFAKFFFANGAKHVSGRIETLTRNMVYIR